MMIASKLKKTTPVHVLYFSYFYYDFTDCLVLVKLLIIKCRETLSDFEVYGNSTNCSQSSAKNLVDVCLPLYIPMGKLL